MKILNKRLTNISGNAIQENQKISPWKGLLWMVGIWLLSVLALGCVASLFKLMMYAAGMRTQ